jgi:hypothetical protein
MSDEGGRVGSYMMTLKYGLTAWISSSQRANSFRLCGLALEPTHGPDFAAINLGTSASTPP